jgi:hypothetical protein
MEQDPPIYQAAPQVVSFSLGCLSEASKFAVKIVIRHALAPTLHFAVARGHWFRTAVGISLAHAEPAGPGHRSRTVLFSALPPGPNPVFCSGRNHVAGVRPLPGILSRWIRRNRMLSGTRFPLASKPPHQAASGGLFVPHRPRCWPRSGCDPGEYILLSRDHWSCFRRSLWLARVLCFATIKQV